MTKPRSEQISLEATPYYHCVSRCVRRAYLCGDAYEHRRQWVEDKLLALAEIFCIDIAAYAVMSNHYHVVLHVDHSQAQTLSTKEVITRWHQLFKGNYYSQRYILGDTLDAAELKALSDIVDLWRTRLEDISWFMRLINEGIARQANAEEQCTGRFWEGRFKSQALLDEKALLACMAYVDLNPIRAKMAKTPETSEYTSIKHRSSIAACSRTPNTIVEQASQLLPFAGNPKQSMPKGVAAKLTDYLALVDITGRAIRENKRGSIDASESPILERLGLDEADWLTATQDFEGQFGHIVGGVQALLNSCHQFLYERIPHHFNCSRLLH